MTKCLGTRLTGDYVRVVCAIAHALYNNCKDLLVVRSSFATHTRHAKHGILHIPAFYRITIQQFVQYVGNFHMVAQLAERLISHPDDNSFDSQQGHRSEPQVAGSVLTHTH